MVSTKNYHLNGTAPHTEEELVRLLRSQSQSGFETLYDCYGATLLGIAFAILKDREEAEDVLQNAFLKIWLNSDHYDPAKGRLFTWLLTITRNCARDALRKRVDVAHDLNNDLNELLPLPDQPARIIHGAEVSHIKTVLQQLNPQTQLLIELAYFQGYTQTEISKELNWPLGTVKTRIRSAIQQLKSILQT